MIMEHQIRKFGRIIIKTRDRIIVDWRVPGKPVLDPAVIFNKVAICNKIVEQTFYLASDIKSIIPFAANDPELDP